MFSFHKPKIYRSNLGCCICKAKSSSSRFTDSKKYENEFERCFRIEERRSGEICNACVLLVKRWKKLSAENRLTKHWHHVVDARAGPGTKLTGNRRLTSGSGSAGAQSRSAEGSLEVCEQSRLEVLPLSSSSANNQAANASPSGTMGGSVRRRTGSFGAGKSTRLSGYTNNGNSAPELSTRRSYMAVDNSSFSSSNAIAKPQSALNSSAFESVIKRFRQRQQQQQLEAKRRQQNRQQRLSQQRPATKTAAATATSDQQVEGKTASELRGEAEEGPTGGGESAGGHSENGEQRDALRTEQQRSQLAAGANSRGRSKKCSESIGSLCVDGLRVSSLLDAAIWRKEKICCGIIFRGLHNEVAVFPKLLKPCQCRADKHRLRLRLVSQQEEGAENEEGSGGELLVGRPAESPPPPPRVTKSGSISSCDSNTSGTGSMEQPLSEVSLQRYQLTSSKQRRKSTLRPLDLAAAGQQSSAASAEAAQGCDNKPQVRAKSGQTPAKRRQVCSKRKRQCDEPEATISSAYTAATFACQPGERRFGSSMAAAAAGSSSPSSSSSSGASSSRLLLMAGDEGAEGDAEEEEEEDNDESAMEELESGSSSLESLAEPERKKPATVGALLG